MATLFKWDARQGSLLDVITGSLCTNTNNSQFVRDNMMMMETNGSNSRITTPTLTSIGTDSFTFESYFRVTVRSFDQNQLLIEKIKKEIKKIIEL